MDQLYKKLKEFGHVKLNEPLSKHTTFKIGGPADFFIEVKEREKLVELLNYVNGEGISYYILGGGSNMLFSDERFEGVVIRFKSSVLTLESSNTIEAEAGVLLSSVISLAMQNSLSGLEWAVGIPGTVGGAVRGNAGAMGKHTGTSISKVEVWRNGEIVELSAEECGFKYRGSNFQTNGDVILRVWFTLTPGDKKVMAEEMQTYIKQRNGRYPAYASPGCFFKNFHLDKWPGNIKELPELFQQRGTVPAGWLVEQVGMKGFTNGGAKISDEHGNFIVNFNDATQHDVLTIFENVKEKVYTKFNVELEPEVEIVK